MAYVIPSVNPDELTAMRAWIEDCWWPDLLDPGDLTDEEVVQGVEAHYEGGIATFLTHHARSAGV